MKNENKFRVHRRAYDKAKVKIGILTKLEEHVSTMLESLDISEDTKQSLSAFLSSLDSEIDSAEEIMNGDPCGECEIYHIFNETFKKVYDDSLTYENCCKECDIKFPCKNWNTYVGCIYNSNPQYMPYIETPDRQEQLGIRYEGVFKKLTPEERKIYLEE